MALFSFCMGFKCLTPIYICYMTQDCVMFLLALKMNLPQNTMSSPKWQRHTSYSRYCLPPFVGSTWLLSSGTNMDSMIHVYNI